MPQDMVVAIPGYEGGYQGLVTPIAVMPVCDSGKDAWIWGRYDKPPKGQAPDLEVVTIGRRIIDY